MAAGDNSRDDFTSSFQREIQLSEDEVLNVSQLYLGDVGCVVWDAALVLGNFLLDSRHFPPNSLTGKSAIELGAGTGAVGLIACSLGADVTITDLECCLPLMRRNIEDNAGVMRGRIQAKILEWGQPLVGFDSPDYILMADVVYYNEVLVKLVETVTELASPTTVVYMCYELRTTGDKPQLEKKFFKLMADHFITSEVPYHDLPHHFRSEDIKLFKFVKRI